MVIVVRPSAAKDQSSVLYGRNNTTFSTVADGFAATGGDTFIAKGSPFLAASFAEGELEQRLVGLQLKVWNADPALSRMSGAASYWAPNPDHSIVSTETFAGIESLAAARVTTNERMSREPLLLTYDSMDMFREQEWKGTPIYNDNPSTAVKGTVFVAQNSNGSANVYIEYIAHWEARGREVTAFATRNETDPEGFSAVYQGVNDVLRSVSGTAQTAGQMIGEAASAAASSLRTAGQLGNAYLSLSRMVSARNRPMDRMRLEL